MTFEYTYKLSIVLVQILRKAFRKVTFFCDGRQANRSKDTILLEYKENPAIDLKQDVKLSISMSIKPPYEAYMFFPVGRRPPEDSLCFVAYRAKSIAGWAWIHHGVRQDVIKSHSLDFTFDPLWFGPDYVRPKYRGKSVQKHLINARLQYVKVNSLSTKAIITLIGKDNKPSLSSYNKMGFRPLIPTLYE